MNELDELRTTLDEIAAERRETPHADRFAGLARRRRAAVRRRHRTAIAAVVAAVAVVAAGAVALPRLGGSNLGPSAAPQKMTSLGHTYELARTESGDGRTTVTLRGSREPRLISWAATEGDGVELDFGTYDVDLDTKTPNTVPENTTDFSEFHQIAAGSGRQTITATGEGEVTLTVYEVSDRATGHTQGDTTFPDRIAGERRLASAFGDKGQTEVAITFNAPSQSGRLSAFCTGAPRGTEVLLLNHGAKLDDYSSDAGLRCGDEAPFDPAGTDPDRWFLPDVKVPVLTSVRAVLARITDFDEHEEGAIWEPVAKAPDLRIGLAAYGAATAPSTPAPSGGSTGGPPPGGASGAPPAGGASAGEFYQPESEIALGGHEYRLVDMVESNSGEPLRVDVDATDRPMLVLHLHDFVDLKVTRDGAPLPPPDGKWDVGYPPTVQWDGRHTYEIQVKPGWHDMYTMDETGEIHVPYGFAVNEQVD